MFQSKSKFAGRSALAIAALAVGVGAFCNLPARAEDPKMDGGKMMTPMSEESQKMVAEQMMKMKEMAADPAQADKMKEHMAKMMVMDQMAQQMAMDPQFQKQAMEAANDPKMKAMHDEAMAMANDPEQMKKMQSEVMGDEKDMKMVMHHAMMMVMMHGGMGGMNGDMHHMGQDMHDKMDDKMGK